ncbi:hypothetical protein ACO0LM_09575 [Undibacterium sp. Di26W]|uniref:hypothetical protein n=1 Tax=Undibacterium sp. Di26W TaxID=3413035 RepID=UPI003BF2391D
MTTKFSPSPLIFLLLETPQYSVFEFGTPELQMVLASIRTATMQIFWRVFRPLEQPMHRNAINSKSDQGILSDISDNLKFALKKFLKSYRTAKKSKRVVDAMRLLLL